jgi:hypothetical protein
MLLPSARAWLRSWPGPRATSDALVAWLDQCPNYGQVEGPESEWAQRRGATWWVDEYRAARSPTPVGEFTSEALYDRWASLGLGIVCLRPALSTESLHELCVAALQKGGRCTG